MTKAEELQWIRQVHVPGENEYYVTITDPQEEETHHQVSIMVSGEETMLNIGDLISDIEEGCETEEGHGIQMKLSDNPVVGEILAQARESSDRNELIQRRAIQDLGGNPQYNHPLFGYMMDLTQAVTKATRDGNIQWRKKGQEPWDSMTAETDGTKFTLGRERTWCETTYNLTVHQNRRVAGVLWEEGKMTGKILNQLAGAVATAQSRRESPE